MKLYSQNEEIEHFEEQIAYYRNELSSRDPGQRLLLCDENRVRFAAVLLAAYESGIVVVPQPPALSTSAKDFLLSHSKPAAVWSNGQLGQLSTQEPASKDLRLIVYTSGTTGEPKGVKSS